MSLLGDSEDECYVCGKEVSEDPPSVEEDGEELQFCCEDHRNQYMDEEQPNEEEDVCEFC